MVDSQHTFSSKTGIAAEVPLVGSHLTKRNKDVLEWQAGEQSRRRIGVNHEKIRRQQLPVTVVLSTGKSFEVDMTAAGRANVDSLSLLAVLKNQIGDLSNFKFTDADNIDQSLTNDEMIEIGVQCTKHCATLHEKARKLKAMAEIPSDYAVNDTHWQ